MDEMGIGLVITSPTALSAIKYDYYASRLSVDQDDGPRICINTCESSYTQRHKASPCNKQCTLYLAVRFNWACGADIVVLVPMFLRANLDAHLGSKFGSDIILDDQIKQI